MPSPSQLATARARAEALMVDRCKIGTSTLSDELDADGNYPLVVSAPVYEGKCLLRGPRTQPRAAESGGVVLAVTASELVLPVPTSGAVVEGMVAEITASRHDPALVGVRLTIKAPHHQTYAKERRFPVEEVT